jgi:hypothetical protein
MPPRLGCSVFPPDIYRPSRRLAQPQFPDLRYWNELDEGGHFAALEQPATFVSESGTLSGCSVDEDRLRARGLTLT